MPLNYPALAQYPSDQTDARAADARDWLSVLANYREPSIKRSVLEIAQTIVPFLGLWFLGWLALDYSYLVTLIISVPAAGFLVRLFLIQHDCGHGTFFKRKSTNDWIGRVLGVLTLTPYDVWRRAHAIHHATSGHLDKRGVGDIDTLTVREYRALPRWRKTLYRLYRNPIVLFGLGPAFHFIVRHRLPLGHMREPVYWASAMLTNLAVFSLALGLCSLAGTRSFLLVHMPIVCIAASMGVWLFYVQHQFENTMWDTAENWNQHDAALYGSSYYDLPQPIRWFSANIGAHHVHHLFSRIPYYRLDQVLKDYPELSNIRRITLWDSFACARLKLWDENSRKLISFRELDRVR